MNVYLLLLLNALVAIVDASRYLPSNYSPDLRSIAKRYPLTNINQAPRFVIAQDSGKDVSIPDLDLTNIQHEIPDPVQLRELSRNINYLRAGACLKNKLFTTRQVRNKCPVCKWTLLEAWEYDPIEDLVEFSYLGIDPITKSYIVGLYTAHTYPADFALTAYNNNTQWPYGKGTISNKIHASALKINNTMQKSFKGYIKKTGKFIPRYIKFVGHGSAAPVAEIVAYLYQQQNPQMNVNIFTIGLPAYGDEEYENWLHQHWNDDIKRMISTRDSLAQWHFYSHVTNFTRQGPEIITHPIQYKVGIWMTTDSNKHPWDQFDNTPALLEIQRAYQTNTYFCKTNCITQLFENDQLDFASSSNASPFVDYTDQLDCGL